MRDIITFHMKRATESRPPAISVIGVLLTFAGLTAVLASILILTTWLVPSWRASVEGSEQTVLVVGTFYFPVLGVVASLTGLGLLRGTPRSRVAARWVLLALIPVAYGLFVFMALVFTGDSPDLFYWVFFMGSATAWAVVLVVGIIALDRPAVREHFEV